MRRERDIQCANMESEYEVRSTAGEDDTFVDDAAARLWRKAEDDGHRMTLPRFCVGSYSVNLEQ